MRKNVIIFLEDGLLSSKEGRSVIEPSEASSSDLLVVHTKSYLNSLNVCLIS